MKHSEPPARRARIAIVDDHPLVRRGLRELISLQPDLEVCGEAGNAQEAMQLLDHQHPDLMIVDLSLKEGSGLELIKRIKLRTTELKILVSSMHDESLYAERVLSAGALGYVNKQEAMEKVIEAIRHVLAGRVYLSNDMSERMMRRLTTDQPPPDRSPIESLSDRELEVFELIGRGLKTSEIARQLHLSGKTVESHREHIKDKLRLKSGPELNRSAIQWVLEQGR